MTASPVVWHAPTITPEDRQRLNGHQPAVVWLTGLSGSGKSTIANALEKRLNQLGIHSYLLDGDNIRHGLCADLGFGDADRQENIRRIAHVARLFADAGLIVITAFISPFQQERDLARSLLGPNEFLEIFLQCPLAVCESRDPKGMYRKARAGEITQFTGIDSPYEAPADPELVIETDRHTVEEAVELIIEGLRHQGRLS